VQPVASSAPPKSKKNLLLMIVAIIVAIALIVSVVVFSGILGGDKLKATIDPDPVEVDAGSAVDLSVTVEWGGDDITDDPDVDFLWSVDPTTLGSFDFRARADVAFTAAVAGGDGTIACAVTYKGKSVAPEVDLTVNPPVLDAVVVDPSTKTLAPGTPGSFTARALSSVALEIPGVSITWSVTGMASGEYTLSSTTGSTVTFTGNVEGSANLTASGEYNGVTKTGVSMITVGTIPVRTLDYRYYDLLNVPFEEFWTVRWDIYGEEEIISDSFPYYFKWYSAPQGNYWYYGNMMLDITGRNMSEINMNSRPEFLPLFGTARGGNAEIDWRMQYLTTPELSRYPGSGAWGADGWVIVLNGTATLDRQAAMAVMNMTSGGFDDFDTWYALNKATFDNNYGKWLADEGNERLDIYNMNSYPFTLLNFNLTCEKVGDKVEIHYDIVSWGMECLMTRWFHDTFLPIENWYEGMDFHAMIGPERTKLDVTTAITYGIYAYESTVVRAGQTHGDPVWVFETYLQDVEESSIGHPVSAYDPYVDFSYDNYAPGSLWYNKTMPFDYAPGAHNITENETLKIEWPVGVETVFLAQDVYPNGTAKIGYVVNKTDSWVCRYSEPMMSDNTDVAPGTISIDNATGTVLFTGPIDFWNWSRVQTAHGSLADQWDDFGLIPYGIPYVEFGMEHILEPPRIDHFEITEMPASVPAGDAVTFTVTAYDQFSSVFYGYTGRVNFTSSDLVAVLPGNTTFSPSDNGVHVFSNLTFGTEGTQSITVVDVSDDSITGEGSTLVTTARTADRFVLSEVSIPSVLDEAQNITVTVYDQYGDLFTGYDGIVTFGSNRSGEVTLPADQTFPGGVDNIRVEYGVTFHAEGWFLVYCNDTGDETINGELSVPVVPVPSEITSFDLAGETQLQPGRFYDLTVTAYDQYGFVFQGYDGIVTFSTDATSGTYTLPPDTTFVPASDNGVKLIPDAMKFTQEGTYTVTVNDTVVTDAGGKLDVTVAVTPEIVYTMYDFFEQPFGEWLWSNDSMFRPSQYYQDFIIANGTGQHVWVYDPEQNGSHALIMAPYRVNMTAANVSNVDVHNPEFMPILGDDIAGALPQAGAEVEMHIRMEYLDHAWWYSYWIPAWGFLGVPFRNWLNNSNDGYGVGVITTVVMNREAAYEWIGLPTDEPDPASWWGLNNDTYIGLLDEWINLEANERLDIFSGYADFYYPTYLMGMMNEDGLGNIVLTICNINFGYEILMVRWLRESQLFVHEPYMEDFDLHATMGNGIANVTFDAVGMYNFHAVMANGTTGEGAWVWEPSRIDYVPSWYAAGGHPSEYDPYAWDPIMGAYTLYQGWNSGDPRFGKGTSYDSTPQWFNLSEYQTLVVKLPQGSNVVCYQGVGVGEDAILNLSLGDRHDYTDIAYVGEASLGYMITNPANPLDPADIYDPVTKTITIKGPYDFDNPGGRVGILYHGAPWIEFNVVPTLSTESVVEATPEVAADGSSASAMSAEMVSLVVSVFGIAVAVAAIACARRLET